MAGSLIILTGAPESQALDWSPSGMLDRFEEPIARFAGLPRGENTTNSRSVDDSAADYAVWRSLPLEKGPVPNAAGLRFSQEHDLQIVEQYPTSTDFLTTASFSFDTSFQSDHDSQVAQDLVSHFYECSLAVHDDISSSQLSRLLSRPRRSLEASFTTEDTSFRSLDDTSNASNSFVRPPLAARGADYLSDLEDIPNAAYLVSIQPQTMTVNLIVGIISIAAPRTVKTRWGSTKTLVEVLVGDDTKSGFSVTFWLPSEAVADSVLAGLRTQDVVLMQNVALNVFMKKVYGHSLRKDLTRVHLLYRKKLDTLDVDGHYTTSDMSSTKPAHPQLQKARQVRDWVLKFVGGSGNASAKDERGKQPWDMPPLDDTQ
ncbi:hypothetical protein NKR23_g3252 [Pleurostoma richardsiae]|uniref:Nucleic acid-binding, OB-fold protein n=1 Tax=Pleurostoma richardsiae TaxID=41990 RepID=A0AA38RNK1_9PEZI|nr:hypothetical protein NKR23_g3252 [Pleurostoma richardsiae]